LGSEPHYVLLVDPQVIAAVVAGALTVTGTLAAQHFGRRATSKDTEKTLNEQREQLIKTFAEQREQLDKTLRTQSDQLDKTLSEQRTRTLNERFATAAEQLGDDKPAVRIAGVYAIAGLADDWKESRQTCVDVLCAYLRMPYAPDPGQNAPEPQQLAFQAIREVRHTVIRVITAHLKKDAAVSWQGLVFSFNGVIFDGGDFRDAEFSGGLAVFDNAEFSAGTVRFNRARFSGGQVFFGGAKFSGGTVRFELAEFAGGTVSFRGTQLTGGTVDFNHAKFSGGTVIFSHAQFSGAQVHFGDAQFSGGTVDFSEAGDWSSPPAFPWTGTPPSCVRLPQTRD
jgi:uncharacterized protein YjbI with pentapeptide repeats